MNVASAVLVSGVGLTITLIPHSTAFASPAVGERGWVCSEKRAETTELQRTLGADEMLRKFRVVDDRLVDAEAATFGVDWGWKVLVNNQEGLIAVSVSTDPSGDPKSPVEADTIVIDKQTRQFTETDVSAGAPNKDEVWHGECAEN